MHYLSQLAEHDATEAVNFLTWYSRKLKDLVSSEPNILKNWEWKCGMCKRDSNHVKKAESSQRPLMGLQQSDKIPRPEAGFRWPLTKCVPVQTSNYKINLQLKIYKTNKNQRLLTWCQGNHTKRHIQYAKVKSQKVIVWSRDSCEKKKDFDKRVIVVH